jgi:hypothetical protein
MGLPQPKGQGDGQDPKDEAWGFFSPSVLPFCGMDPSTSSPLTLSYPALTQ